MDLNNNERVTGKSAVIDPYDRCFYFYESARAWFGRFDGVLGVGIGPKEKDKIVDPYTPCFIVYVVDKRPLDQLAFNERIPSVYAGVPTDVIVPGERTIGAHNGYDESWLEWDATDLGMECPEDLTMDDNAYAFHNLRTG
ncbi:MAG: hypothetical protein OEX00_09645 [Gammaproteobacteria bacterium]|nr:hypothetical protein [Gammaproteobacteria bacterium]